MHSASISMMAEDWKTNFMNDKRKRAKEKNSFIHIFSPFSTRAGALFFTRKFNLASLIDCALQSNKMGSYFPRTFVVLGKLKLKAMKI